MRFRHAFSLYPRDTGQHRVWYYRTYRPDGTRAPGRSTGLTSKTAAHAYCEELHRAGRLIPAKDFTFGEYAADWWLWGECAYLRDRLDRSAPGRPRVSERYAYEQRRRLELHILPEFRNIRLSALTPAKLDRWILRLRNEGLAGKTCNHLLSNLSIMLHEAKRRGLIAVDPTEDVRRLGEDRTERGTLNLDEVRRLFAEDAVKAAWNGLRMHRALNMLAAATGLRLGEIQALTGADVRKGHVHVGALWDRRFGLGPTKTRTVRDVPVPTKVAAALAPLLGRPGFVFSADGSRPLDQTGIRQVFYRACTRIGIPREEIRARGICFHSWRRFANTILRARGIPDALVRDVTGHESAAMTEHYTEFQLEHFAPVLAVQEEVFG